MSVGHRHTSQQRAQLLVTATGAHTKKFADFTQPSKAFPGAVQSFCFPILLTCCPCRISRLESVALHRCKAVRVHILEFVRTGVSDACRAPFCSVIQQQLAKRMHASGFTRKQSGVATWNSMACRRCFLSIPQESRKVLSSSVLCQEV